MVDIFGQDCPRVLVGIDGLGGSGKSIVPALLIEALDDAYLGHSDDFPLPSSGQTNAWAKSDQLPLTTLIVIYSLLPAWRHPLIQSRAEQNATPFLRVPPEQTRSMQRFKRNFRVLRRKTPCESLAQIDDTEGLLRLMNPIKCDNTHIGVVTRIRAKSEAGRQRRTR